MAVVLGILALLIALIGGILCGVIGGGVGILLAVIAIVLGVKRKKDGLGGGTAATVLAIIAIVFGLLATLLWGGAAGALREAAKEKNIKLIEESAGGLNFGVVGFIISAQNHGYSVDEIQAALDQFSEK